jgi:hypothetical protein
VATSTPTATTTTTGTATSSVPSWCVANSITAPSYAQAGNPLSAGIISNGTWHTIDSSGAEWVLNCTVKNDGKTTCCGSLLSEATLWNAPSVTTWGGFSMQHCINWTPGMVSNAPTISGTGYTVSGMEVDLVNSNPRTWNPDGAITIAACQS